ncbi:MAG: HipA domain-containing protein [Erysipelotrichaceae bacterium]
MKSYLMNKNQKVALVEFNTTTIAIDKVYDVISIQYAPLSLENAYNDRSKNLVKELNNWFKGRGIPSWRKDVEKLLRNLEVKTTDELLNKAYALSLSDQYWIKEENSTIQWKDINFFENEFEYKAFLQASLNDSSSRHPDLKSPNNTTDGMLQKAWVIEDGKRVLVKGTYTPSRQEPINEWLASQICERLGFKYCPYEIDIMDDKIISKCDNFVSSNEEIISAYDVFCSEKKNNSINDFQHYLSILEKHNVPNAQEDLENMFIIDCLTMNTDRHMKNFGVIRNVETLSWERLTPIFDTGQSMNCHELAKNINFNDGYGKYFSNTNKKFSTYLSNISNLERLDVSKLNGLDMQFNQILKKYQDYTEMTDDRIKTLTEGLSSRIKFLQLHKELDAINN